MESGLVIFVDIEGSTKLYESLGDLAAYTKIASTLAQLGELIVRHGGLVIKHIGDEILCFFEHVVPGMQALIMAQIESSTSSQIGGDLAIRIGCHYGSVLVRNGDLFGDTVNVAAHLASLARGNQILTSQSCIELYHKQYQVYKNTCDVHEFLDFQQPLEFRPLTKFSPKGKEFQVNAVLVRWESFLEDVVADWTFVHPLPEFNADSAVFNLECKNKKWQINGSKNKTTVGRVNDVEIIIPDRNVSRQHGFFEYENGQLKFTDQSSNGTYFSFSNQQIQFVHRQSVIITGDGLISFGIDFEDNKDNIFRFWFEQDSK